jgi:hypothetical protein
MTTALEPTTATVETTVFVPDPVPATNVGDATLGPASRFAAVFKPKQCSISELAVLLIETTPAGI